MKMTHFNLLPVPRARKRAAQGWAEPADAEARALDNAVLTAVRLRLWMGAPTVAREVGQSREWVRKVTNAVQADDMATPDPRASAADMDKAYAYFGAQKALKVRS